MFWEWMSRNVSDRRGMEPGDLHRSRCCFDLSQFFEEGEHCLLLFFLVDVARRTLSEVTYEMR